MKQQPSLFPWYIKLNFLVLGLFIVGFISYKLKSEGLTPKVTNLIGLPSANNATHNSPHQQRTAKLVSESQINSKPLPSAAAKQTLNEHVDEKKKLEPESK